MVSNFGRAMSLTARVIKKLDPVPLLLEVDVTNEDHLAVACRHNESISTILTGWCIRLPSPIRRQRSVASSSIRRGPTSVPRCRCRLLAGVVDDGLQAAAGRAGLGRWIDL